jgi:hypothetical protein
MGKIGASVANDFKDFSAILVVEGEQEREAGHEKAASSESLPPTFLTLCTTRKFDSCKL